jgi:hypothetical protein
MHSHGNPNQRLPEKSLGRAALQISVSSFDDLTGGASGEAAWGVLYLICSL